MSTILAMNDGCAGNELAFAVVFKLVVDAIELRMVVHHAQPAVNRDDRNDAAALGRKCVDFLRERVKPVFVLYDDERQ